MRVGAEPGQVHRLPEKLNRLGGGGSEFLHEFSIEPCQTRQLGTLVEKQDYATGRGRRDRRAGHPHQQGRAYDLQRASKLHDDLVVSLVPAASPDQPLAGLVS